MSSIAILGDSHTGIYRISNIFNYFHSVNIHHIDWEDITRNKKFMPYTMNSIASRGELILDSWLKKYEDVEYIMLIFGEPDIRIHFYKQIYELKRDPDEVVITLANNFIKKLLEIFMNTNKKIIIRYVLPQREISMYGCCNNIYVPRGLLSDRVLWTNKLNAYMKEICLKYPNKILFFENFAQNEFIKESGELKNEYCDGSTHYNHNNISEIDIFCKNNNIEKVIKN